MAGTADEIELVDLTVKAHLFPDVIAQGYCIHPCLTDLLGRLGGNAGSTSRILTVGEDEIDAQFFPIRYEPALEKSPGRATHDITQDEDSHLFAGVS